MSEQSRMNLNRQNRTFYRKLKVKKFFQYIVGGLLASVTFAVISNGVVIKDGDTLKIDGETWRLWGIDAPEDGQPCEVDGLKTDCGDQATEALNALVGGAVPLCQHKDTDRYGRSVGRCFVDGRDLGAQLVRQGWALDYRRYSGGFYDEQQAEAKEQRRGMWAGEFVAPWEYLKK